MEQESAPGDAPEMPIAAKQIVRNLGGVRTSEKDIGVAVAAGPSSWDQFAEVSHVLS
jgi:hypothetical protein